MRLVVFHRFADRQAVALGDRGEMFHHRFERLQIDLRVVAERFQIVGDVEHRRLRRAVGERRDRGVQNAHAELDAFEIIERRLAAVAVGVKLHGDIAGGFEHHRDQRARALGREQAADVFEADAPGLGRRGFLGFLGVVFVGVARRDRINQIRHRVHAMFFQIGDLFAEGVVVVPAVRRARQRQAVGDQPLDQAASRMQWGVFSKALCMPP